MSSFVSVKVFRGTFPNEERLGQFAGQPGACFRVATDDDGDSRTLDLDSDDFEYIPPVTYRVVDEFLAEHEDDEDD
ncbi:hypothetical protein ACUUKW_001609 [Escherichia coli]|nr:hypothetical protein [Escherichia coli]